MDRRRQKVLPRVIEDVSGSQVKCVFWNESLKGYWNEYQIRNYGKTRFDYNNKESDIDEDDNEPEEDWKIKAEESDSDIVGVEMNDGDNEHRIRARNN